MSIKVSTWVWDHPDLGQSERSELLVLLALADISDNDGWCGYAKKDQRTQRELADRCRLGESTFQAAVKRLREKGLLATSRDGRNEPNVYQILVPWATPEIEGSDRDPDSGAQTPSNEGSDTQELGFGDPDSGVRSSIDGKDVANGSSPAKPTTQGQRFAQPLCDVLAAELIRNEVKVPGTTSKRWLDAARLLVDVDKRDPHQAKALIEWACRDAFWRSNILSMPTFRAQYDKLRLARERGGRGRQQQDLDLIARAAAQDSAEGGGLHALAG